MQNKNQNETFVTAENMQNKEGKPSQQKKANVQLSKNNGQKADDKAAKKSNNAKKQKTISAPGNAVKADLLPNLNTNKPGKKTQDKTQADSVQPKNQKSTRSPSHNFGKSKNNKNSRNDKRKAVEALGRYGSIPAGTFLNTDGVKITFLGGINEIGKNLTLFEYNNEIIIMDCGMSFPDADMPGIDYVIPDFSYIERNIKKIKAIFITHGHEDHIGGLPYLLKTVNVPLYASKLTVGLIQGKLREHRMLNKCKLNVIKPGDIISAGAFQVEAIHVNHSIPDALAFAFTCEAGTILHTGDFKIDNTPIDGGVIDLARFASLGNEGVLCLLADSTNAERAGYTPSEKMVGETLEMLFRRAEGKRIIVASFASNIHRVQQIIDASKKIGRKIFLSGRSLENVTKISKELGYLNVPDGLLLPIDSLKNYNDGDVVIITTGSQGEPMSALSRMAMNDHRKVTIGSNDFVVISATPIPGNEKTVANTINELMKLGAEVIYEKNLGIHVSGHAAQEELKLVLNLVKPKYFIPVHGEQKHLRRHAALAESTGISSENIMIPELGSVIQLDENYITSNAPVESGRVYIDGSGVGDVGIAVLGDRKKLSTDGIVIITAVTDAYTGALTVPLDIQSKGFVFTNNTNELNSLIADAGERVLDNFMRSVNMDVNSLKLRIKDAASKAIYERTRRSPVIIVTVFSI